MADSPLPAPLHVLAAERPLAEHVAAARAEALAGASRAPLWSRGAIAAAIGGDRAAAESLLGSARALCDREQRGEVELASACVSLEQGDALRALGALARAEEAGLSRDARAAARALHAAALALDRGPRDALASLDEPDLSACPQAIVLHRVVHARIALAAGELDEASRSLRALGGDAARTGLLACDLELVRAEAAMEQRPPDASTARALISRAVWRLLRLGAPRRLGLSYLAMAHVEAAGADVTLPAAWLARAQPLVGRVGTAQDQEALRRAFRLYGRRAVDRLVDADLGVLMDTLRARHAQLCDLLGAHRDAREAGQPDDRAREEGALDELGRLSERVIAVLESVLVDRERVGQLVTVTQRLARAESAAEIAHLLPRLSMELCAADGAELHAPLTLSAEPRERFGVAPPLGRQRLAREIAEALDEGSARLVGHETLTTRAGVESGGRVAIVPLIGAGRGEDARAALVVSRAARGGQIGERDLERLTVLARLGAATLARAHAAEALAEAASRDAATLEAIRDGIVTFDEYGRVRAMNRAAARMLRIAREDAIAQRAEDVPAMGPLVSALGESRSVEGDVVALPHGELLVRARPYEGGVVATLQELSSAQRLAQRLVGGAARFALADLVGDDAAFRACLADAQRAARSDVPVLVTGESGTGKEMLAQAIHNASPRSGAPFVGINVAAIPRELLESELFGYERGAFTGARAGGLVGKLELAGEGTVLLDEIGDMPWEMQAKLLRVLQERTVVRLGGSREVPIRARIVATTHRDLETAIQEGTFRLDLFYRLRGVHLRLPPLRERRGDVPRLVEHCLARVAEREGRVAPKVAPHVMEALVAYAWPGNVRELANLIEGEAALLPPGEHTLTRVPASIVRAASSAQGPSAQSASAPSTDSGVRDVLALGASSADVEPFDEYERRVFAFALSRMEGNVTAAAKALGVARGTFYAKIKRYGLLT